MLITACTTVAPYTLITEEIAVVTQTVGVPNLIRGAQPYLLAPQSRLYARDAISTDKYAMVQLGLVDQSHIVIAPSSRVLIRDAMGNGEGFITELSQNQGSIEIMALPSQGSHRIVISAALARITTSTGNFWINHRLNGSQLDVVMTGEGQVKVENGHGSVILSERYETTTIPSGAAPRPVLQWSESRFNDIRARRNEISEH
ncbi:MAG: hypothetical protein ACI8Z1_003547 [Candidatus Azotimanducaceae bacterium]|jgi:hypothetical protein